MGPDILQGHMHTYIFHGRVIPERSNAVLSGLGPIAVVQPESGVRFELTLSIQLSIISAVVISKDEIFDLLTVRNHLVGAIALFVDAIGFGNGCGYAIQLDSCTTHDRNLIAFGVDIHELGGSTNWVDTNDVINAYLRATDLQKSQLQFALGELRNGIRNAADSGFHAYRAIESISQAFTGSWKEMNTVLHLKKEYTRIMKTDHADKQRHGNPTLMTSEERTGMLIKTKTVISRFVSYILTGNKKLDATDYPELS